MTNQEIVLLYSPFIIITVFLLFHALVKGGRSRLARRFVAFYGLLLGWQCLEILFYLLKDEFLIRYVFDLKLAFIAWLAVAIFFLVSAFYRVDRYFPRWLPLFIWAVPALTTIFAVTSPCHSLLIKTYEVASLSPLTTILRDRGFWFVVHQVSSQLLILGIAVIILIYFSNLPRAYQSGTVFMLWSLLFYFLMTAFETFAFDSGPVDYTLVATSIAGVLFYCATLIKDRQNYLYIDRREMLGYLDKGVIIVDTHGQIVDMNDMARKIFAYDDRLRSVTFQQLLDTLVADGKLIRRNSEYETGEDLLVPGDGYPTIYHMRSQPITRKEGSVTGRFTILSNVTQSRLFIERLREMAGVDPLTGLPNRLECHRALRVMDIAENLPLSVVVGDVNGLKLFNDTYGHYEGDLLLRWVSEAMSACCPENGLVGRMGGDEFIMFLPGCDREETVGIIAGIQKAIEENKGLAAPPAISFGYAIKRNMKENISALIYDADMDMYSNKGADPNRVPREGGASGG